MIKTLIGFAAGVILASLMFVLFSTDSIQSLAPVTLVNSDDNSDSTPTAPFATTSPVPGIIGRTEEQASGQIASPALPETVRTDSRSQRERLQEQWQEARRVAREASEASSEALSALTEYDRARLMEKPIINHLPLTKEFDWIDSSGFDGFKTNHERIQREVRDIQWAAPTEQQLWNFLNDRQEFLQTYGAPTVTCAETLCEMTLVSFGVSAEAAYADFNSLRLELISNPNYRASFDRSPQWAERADEDVAALFVILRRLEE